MWIDSLPYVLLMLGSITVACFSQILLKKAATKHYERFIDQYLNWPVVIAYALFFLSTVLTTFGYRGLPLSATPVFNALSQILVSLLAFLLLKERPGRRKLIGLAIVIAGIVIFSL